jgi:Tfp pilus assembly protein PilO
MDKLKQYVALTVVGCLAVLAGGWFLLVSPKRTEAAELRLQADEQVTANATLQTQIEVLKAQAKNLPKEQAKLAAVAAKVPPSRAMPALIRSLTVAAEDAGVELVTLAPGTTAVAAPVAAAAPVAPAAGTAAPAPGAPAAVAPAPAGPQLGTIPVTLNVVGGYFQVQQFLSNLEELKRAIRFTNVTLAPGSNPVKPAAPGSAPVDDGRTLAATLTGQVFQQVVTAAPAAAVAPVVAPAK